MYGTDLIRQPNHEYRNTYPEKVVEAFEIFTESCSNTLGDSGTYPNAAIHVEPSPAYMKSGVLSFAAVWGRSTEMPLPRQHMIAEYFGSTALGLRFKKKPRELITLDGNGFIGAVSLDKETQNARLSVVTGVKDSNKIHIMSHQIIDAVTADYAMVDILSKLITHRPLRFHQGVKWIPRNGYLRCIFSAEDEHRAQEVLMRRV